MLVHTDGFLGSEEAKTNICVHEERIVQILPLYDPLSRRSGAARWSQWTLSGPVGLVTPLAIQAERNVSQPVAISADARIKILPILVLPFANGLTLNR